jgi:UDP-2-acetamido-3-amino-2,3-dideoxy-glucuronate N-acetyltransferase
MNHIVSLIDIPVYSDHRGQVVSIEFSHLPFIPQRFFTTTGNKPGVIRGQHGHFLCEQILFSLRGEISVLVQTAQISETYLLHPTAKALYVPSGVWASQTFQKGTEILGCLASHSYDPNDLFQQI